MIEKGEVAAAETAENTHSPWPDNYSAAAELVADRYQRPKVVVTSQGVPWRYPSSRRPLAKYFLS